MTTIRSITPTAIYNFYELQGVQESASPSNAPMCFIGRHNQVVSAFDSAGQVLESAKAGTLRNQMRSWRRALVLEGTRYDLPGVFPSAVVSSEDVSVFGVLGSGTSRTIDDIRTVGDEEVVFTGSIPLVDTDATKGNLTIVDPIRNFTGLLAQLGYPSQDSGTSGLISTPGELVVRVAGAENDVPVLNISATAIETAAQSGFFTVGQTYSLVYKPAVARVESGAQFGRVMLSGCNRPQLGLTSTNFGVRLSSWTPNALEMTDGAGSDLPCSFYTTHDPADYPNGVELIFDTATTGAGPSASISAVATDKITVTITLDDTNNGAGAYDGNTVDALNAALLTAASSAFPPIFFDGGGNSDAAFDPAVYFPIIGAGPVATVNSASLAVDGATVASLLVSQIRYSSILNQLPYVPFFVELENIDEVGQYDVRLRWTGLVSSAGTDVGFNPTDADWWTDRTSPLDIDEAIDANDLPISKWSGGTLQNKTASEVLTAMSAAVEAGNPNEGKLVWAADAFALAQTEVVRSQIASYRAMPRYAAANTGTYFPYLYYVDSADDLMKPVDLSSRTASMPANERVWYADLRYTQSGVIGNGFTVRFEFSTTQTDPVTLTFNAVSKELVITLRTSTLGTTTTSDGSVTLEDLADALAADTTIPFEIANVYEVSNDLVASIDAADYDTLLLDGFGLLGNVDFRRYSELDSAVVDYGAYEQPVSSSAVTRHGSASPALVIDTPFFDPDMEVWETLENITFDIYTSYTALRTDTSAIATVLNHGRKADLLAVTRATYKQILGDPDINNPLALAAQQYFEKRGVDNIVYFLGVDEVSDAQPLGTDEAITRALDLVKRRTPYHVFVLNDAPSMSNLLASYANGLGGLLDETEAQSELQLIPRPRPMYLYTSTTNPENSLPIEKVTGNLTSKTVNSGSTVVTVDQILTNFVEDQRLFMVFPNFLNAGPDELTDGRTGWAVAYNSGEPQMSTASALLVGELPIFITDEEPFILVQNGRSLTLPNGTFDAATAIEDLRAFHSQANFFSRGLAKLHLDSYATTFNQFQQRVDGYLLLGQLAAIISRHDRGLPVTSLEFADAVDIYGTVDLYSGDGQLEALIGCGLIVPRAKGSSLTAAEVARDVTSYTFADNDDVHRLFIKRTSFVVDDLLTRSINAKIRPYLGPDNVNDEVLGLIGELIEGEIRRYRRYYKTLRLEAVVEIDDQIRSRFGLNASGVYYRMTRRHREELTDIIAQNVILVGPEDPVSNL